MFEVVNEIAVVGTSLFMVAVATLWYSPYLFQKLWMRAVGLTYADIEKGEERMMFNFIVTLVSYVIAVFLIAILIGYAQIFGIAVQKVAVSLAIGFAALLAGFVVWEQRSFLYYLVTIGFSSVFIIGSTCLLYYWPW